MRKKNYRKVHIDVWRKRKQWFNVREVLFGVVFIFTSNSRKKYVISPCTNGRWSKSLPQISPISTKTHRRISQNKEDELSIITSLARLEFRFFFFFRRLSSWILNNCYQEQHWIVTPFITDAISSISCSKSADHLSNLAHHWRKIQTTFEPDPR